MLRPFDYYRPDDMAETIALLGQEPSAAVLAGGTDVVVKLRRGSLKPSIVLDIKGLEELRSVAWQDGYLSLGALTTFNDLLESPEVSAAYAMHGACGVNLISAGGAPDRVLFSSQHAAGFAAGLGYGSHPFMVQGRPFAETCGYIRRYYPQAPGADELCPAGEPVAADTTKR